MKHLKILLSLTLLVMTIALCGCGFSRKEVKKNEALSVDYSSLSDNPFSYDLLIDGKKYTLPVQFSELEKDGWKVDEKFASQVLATNFYNINVNIVKGKKHLTASFFNAGDNACKLNKCYVGSITSFGGVGDSKVSVVLPRGMSFNAAKDELEKAYGKPSKVDTSTKTFDTYTYIDPNAADSDYQKIEIMLNKEDHSITGLKVENMYTKEELEQN